jgi:hypothetical protein
MTILTTSRRGIHYPNDLQSPDGPAQMQQMATDLDNHARDFSGTDAAKSTFTPPGGWGDGDYYFATDTAVVYRYRTGSGLGAVNPKNAAANVASLRTLGTGSLEAAAGTDARFPSTDQKAALAGAGGTPGAGNKFVTQGALAYSYDVCEVTDSTTSGTAVTVLHISHSLTTQVSSTIEVELVGCFATGPGALLALRMKIDSIIFEYRAVGRGDVDFEPKAFACKWAVPGVAAGTHTISYEFWNNQNNGQAVYIYGTSDQISTLSTVRQVTS